MNAQPAAFIDRDGTINIGVHYLNRVEQLQLIPRAGEAIARLNQAGYPVILITNQSAIGRGLLTETELAEIHRRTQTPIVRLQRNHRCHLPLPPSPRWERQLHLPQTRAGHDIARGK